MIRVFMAAALMVVLVATGCESRHPPVAADSTKTDTATAEDSTGAVTEPESVDVAPLVAPPAAAPAAAAMVTVDTTSTLDSLKLADQSVRFTLRRLVDSQPYTRDPPAVALPDSTWTRPAPVPEIAGGIPYGMSHVPASSMISEKMTGTLAIQAPATVKALLDTVHRSHARVFLGLTNKRPQFIDSVRHVMSVKKWTTEFDAQWRPYTAVVKQGFADRSILAIYAMDEPNWPPAWKVPTGWKGWTRQQVDTIACYVKQVWPFARVSIRVHPDWFAKAGYKPRCVDNTWGAYVGMRYGAITVANLKKYADSLSRTAARIGTTFALGFNPLNGGYEGPGGTGTDPSQANKQATPRELKTADSFFIAYRGNCAAVAWRYAKNYKGESITVTRFDTLKAVRAARAANADLAAKQRAPDC